MLAQPAFQRSKRQIGYRVGQDSLPKLWATLEKQTVRKAADASYAAAAARSKPRDPAFQPGRNHRLN